MRQRWPVLLLLAVVVFTLVPVDDADARRGFSGFGRTSLRTSGLGVAARKALSGRRKIGWGRASTRVTRATGGRAGRSAGWSGGNMSRRVGTRGRAFSSRSAAEAAYRRDLKTRWDRRPAKRPAYVPDTVTAGGRKYDVTFNDGTYGYWGPGRTWVALGAAGMLANAALMANRGYYYGAGYGGRSYSQGGSLFLAMLIAFAVVSRLGRGRRR